MTQTLTDTETSPIYLVSAARVRVINPNYYKIDWDLDSEIAVAKFVRKSFQSAPLKHIIAEDI
ncbi:hypothetical protein BO70DRAFT_400965 [Aspergillus heteromorphus CBS 117.55]|uniref:Uncharacterized protein n=1 Tax=Aspergillus heteromorphus CBS 117.55 TaxID=1448321 RepID=A0A317UWG2_9EURO|nr:uncharacterized protein BO70DRAFT_400965 [Aspergillus heteromorphus CBS 117.55]PWY66015.1 hypothetical protein BO70DRAFT_400965 [Aspergillus heteromorphus CBS 117.55]